MVGLSFRSKNKGDGSRRNRLLAETSEDDVYVVGVEDGFIIKRDEVGTEEVLAEGCKGATETRAVNGGNVGSVKASTGGKTQTERMRGVKVKRHDDSLCVGERRGCNVEVGKIVSEIDGV
jgi:hypothetical protein